MFRLFFSRSLMTFIIMTSFFALPAYAATQGTLGATSTGTVNLSITKSVQAQISDLSDMTLANWNVGDGAVTLFSNACIYSSTGSYKVTATGSGVANIFTLSSGANILPYTVAWNAGGSGNLSSKEQVIYLSPYHIYNIRIAPESSGLFNYDVNDRKVVLYEGNVSQQEWVVNNFYVLVGNVVKTDGQPLQNAMLQESRSQVTTTETGKLQAELSRTDIIHFIGQDNQSCEVKLPDNVTAINGVLLYRQPLICQPVNQSYSQHL